jgi:hypothetical protein
MVPRLMMRRASSTVTVVRSLVQISVLLSSPMQTSCQSCPLEVFAPARIEGALDATPPPFPCQDEHPARARECVHVFVALSPREGEWHAKPGKNQAPLPCRVE